LNTLDVQVGGDHYKKMKLQPWEIIEANNLDFWEGNALKYLLRWRSDKGKPEEDLDKVIHYIEHIKTLYKKGHYATSPESLT
jgi:hypothetical protein